MGDIGEEQPEIEIMPATPAEPGHAPAPEREPAQPSVPAEPAKEPAPA